MHYCPSEDSDWVPPFEDEEANMSDMWFLMFFWGIFWLKGLRLFSNLHMFSVDVFLLRECLLKLMFEFYFFLINCLGLWYSKDKK